MYCGDGINDLAALAAADVGMAIGSSDASAAASVSDKHTSVSGIGCRQEQKRKCYTLQRQMNEKPSVIPGCPGVLAVSYSQRVGMPSTVWNG